MCGRFSQVFQEQDLMQISNALTTQGIADDHLLDLLSNTYATGKPSYNIAPTQHAMVIHSAFGLRKSVTQGHFGLIPSWAKDRSRSSSMINARSETVASKPAFRDVFRSRRCLLPIKGFYEWQRRSASSNRQPWYIQRCDDQPMFLAGVCDTWLDPEHGHCEVDSFALITVPANAFMSPIHHRMPVVIESPQIPLWFDTNTRPRDLDHLLSPAQSHILARHQVSTQVNSSANDGPDLIKPGTASTSQTLWG